MYRRSRCVEATGALVCNDVGTGTECDAQEGPSSAEICGNEIDEDCDGTLDNGFDIGETCTVGQGV